MSSSFHGSRATFLYLLLSNIIIIFLLSTDKSLAFAVSTDAVTGLAQIASMPMTSNLADGMINIDNVNTNPSLDENTSTPLVGTVPIVSGAESNSQLPTSNYVSPASDTMTEPLEESNSQLPTSNYVSPASDTMTERLEGSTSLNSGIAPNSNQVTIFAQGGSDAGDENGPNQLGDLESTAINRGKNVQGDLLQGTMNNGVQGETIKGTDHSETIMGLQANDIIYGKGGDDIIYGDEDDDLIYGGAGDDLLNGGTGDNKLDGQGRDDILIGGDTSDILSGGDGNDKLFGYEGNDVLKGGDGSNDFNCGEGIDTVLDFKESRDLLSNDCEIVNRI